MAERKLRPSESATMRWAISSAGATGWNTPAAAPSSTSCLEEARPSRSDIAAHSASRRGCRRTRAHVSIQSTYSSRSTPSDGIARSIVRRSSSIGSDVSCRSS